MWRREASLSFILFILSFFELYCCSLCWTHLTLSIHGSKTFFVDVTSSRHLIHFPSVISPTHVPQVTKCMHGKHKISTAREHESSGIMFLWGAGSLWSSLPPSSAWFPGRELNLLPFIIWAYVRMHVYVYINKYILVCIDHAHRRLVVLQLLN